MKEENKDRVIVALEVFDWAVSFLIAFGVIAAIVLVVRAFQQ